MTAMSRLLKSWATPPVSWPTSLASEPGAVALPPAAAARSPQGWPRAPASTRPSSPRHVPPGSRLVRLSLSSAVLRSVMSEETPTSRGRPPSDRARCEPGSRPSAGSRPARLSGTRSRNPPRFEARSQAFRTRSDRRGGSTPQILIGERFLASSPEDAPCRWRKSSGPASSNRAPRSRAGPRASAVCSRCSLSCSSSMRARASYCRWRPLSAVRATLMKVVG